MNKPLTTPVLQARDLIYEVAKHREGRVLDEATCRDLAANAATALISLLEDLKRGTAVAGEIDEPPPVRPPAGKTARHLEDLETMDEHAERVIK